MTRTRIETAAHLDALEKAVGVTLPAFYREFMLKPPQRLLEVYSISSSGSIEYATDREFLNIVEELERDNAHVRDGDVWESGKGGAWLHEHFVIGNDQSSNYWTIHTGLNDGAVWWYDHYRGTWEKEHESLDDFVDWIVQNTKELNEKFGARE